MSLSFAVVKRFKPKQGVRRGLVDITFDDQGPTWAIANTDFKINGLRNLILPAHIDGFVLSYIPTSVTAGTIDTRQEAGGASALGASDVGDMSAKVVRAEYVGY